MATTAFEYTQSPERPKSLIGRYIAASVGLMAIASVNGVVRELTYAKALGDDAAHWVSLVPMVGLFGAYVDLLERRWPLTSWREAAFVGAAWTAIAAGFEIGVGHHVDGKSFSDLFAEYDISAGRPGALVLVATAMMPAVVRIWRSQSAQRTVLLNPEATQ